MELDSYLEDIDTECENILPRTLSVQALKVDKKGKEALKYKLGLNSLKSCDYISIKQPTVYLIEFSDLNRQLSRDIKLKEDLMLKVKAGGSNLTKAEKSMIKDPMKNIRSEFRTKLTDSLLLYSEIAKKFTIEKISEKLFYIVVCSDDQSDLIAFDRMAGELSEQFKVLLGEVQIMLPSNLETKLAS